jgi:hypothetical protein
MESLKMITEWIRKDPVPVVLALLLSAAAGMLRRPSMNSTLL